jgi:hypothetical protein
MLIFTLSEQARFGHANNRLGEMMAKKDYNDRTDLEKL